MGGGMISPAFSFMKNRAIQHACMILAIFPHRTNIVSLNIGDKLSIDDSANPVCRQLFVIDFDHFRDKT